MKLLKNDNQLIFNKNISFRHLQKKNRLYNCAKENC
jgi:hypothetical protein